MSVVRIAAIVEGHGEVEAESPGEPGPEPDVEHVVADQAASATVPACLR